MGLATDVATRSGTPLPLGEAAQELYERVIREQPELSRKDFSSVYRFLRDAAQSGKKVSNFQSNAAASEH
jgi:3-hydroxyisobutyrate dehydrogenase